MKKLLSIAVALVMCCALLTMPSMAAETVENGIFGIDGDNLSWTLDSDGVLTISGTGEMEDYCGLFNYDDRIKTIVVEEGVTSIGANAFGDCLNLTSVTLPSTLTTLGRNAFSWCESLGQITIPASVTSIGENCFRYSALTEINVEPDSESYASVDGVLFNKDITVLEIYPVSSVRSVYTIPSTVTEIAANAFYGVDNLMNITIPEGVKTIGDRGIYNCHSMSTIHIPASVETLGESAVQNYNLTSITVDEDNKNYASVDGVLFDKDMTTLIQYPSRNVRTYYAIPDGVETIADNAVRNCDYLEEICVPASVTGVGETPFNYNYSLTAITVDGDNKNYASADGVLFDKDMTTLIKYPMAKSEPTYTIPDGVETISRYAFSDALSLRFVEIPEGVTTVENSAFSDCDNMSMIIFPESLEYLDYNVSSYCENLTAVYFPAGLTTMRYQYFWECNALTDIYYGGTEEQWTALSEQYGLEMPETATVHFQADPPEPPVFAEVEWSISSDGVLTVSGTGEMMDYEYDGAPWYDRAQEVTSIVVKKGLTTIGSYAFADCYNAASITIPEGITRIGECAMSWCESLSSITLPDSLKIIDDGAFEGCYELTTLNIPANVTSIGYDVFWNCDSITGITVDADNEYYTDEGGVLFDKEMTVLIAYPSSHSCTSYTIPDSVIWVEEGAFGLVNTLEILNIHASVEDLGYRPFYWENSLTEINVDENNAYYASEEGILYNKDMTSLIHYPSHSAKTVYTMPSTVTVIEEAAICGNHTLTSLTLSKSLSRIEMQGIESCEALTQIKVNVNNTTYAGKDGVLFSKDLSALIRYPMAKTSTSYTVPSSVTTLAEEAFTDAYNLEKVVLPEGLTGISERAFSGCTKLNSVTFPSTLQTIGWRAFASCRSLTEVTIPEGVTSIDYNAFYRCSSMTSLTLPKSLQSIGEGAFFRCDQLTDVYYAGSEQEWLALVGSTDRVLTSMDVDTVIHYGDEVKLAAPTITVTTSASSGKPYIKWTAVEGATEYEVWRCGTSGGTYTLMYTAPATKLNVTHTGAVVGNDYFYKVRAINGSSKSDFSAVKGVWCDLARPTVKVTTRASDGKPYISWDAVEGATGYKVYRCGTSGGTYSLMYTASASKLNVTHTGAVVGNDYYYKVVAVYGDNTKCNSAMSAYKGVWCDLARPTVKVTTRASTGKPYISWNAVDGATGYKVYRCDTSSGTYKLMYTASASKLNVTHTGAVAGNDYFYKVVAVYGDNTKCNSAMSAYKGVWCDLARPTLNVELNSKGKPYLTWNEVEGADGYVVYRSTSKSGTYTKMFTADADRLYVTHTGAAADTTYYYKVMAVCDATSKANSAYSTVVSITAG